METSIRDVRVVTTAPAGSNLVVVKVETSEPGLYGLGCATFTQRYRAVVSAIETYIKPFVVGRPVARIEELYSLMMVNGYWRNGPILNNAIAGIDIALWDIKGKMAGMSVADLLGGKCREAAVVYTHANGASAEEVADAVSRFRDEGYRYVRVQRNGYGGAESSIPRPEGASQGAYLNPREYCRTTLQTLDKVRRDVGDDVELLHDVHERLLPSEVIQFASDVEQFKLFFLEDPLAPEDVDWFEQLRNATATPLAVGELFNNPNEWKNLVARRRIDFVRMHISQIGGITPARHLVSFCNQYAIRTAWHGPGDVSPVGHAANLHLDLWAPNFGVQEWCRFPESIYEVFPGTPVVRDGYMYPNERPGLGIDVDESAAKAFPCNEDVVRWTETRRPDGSPSRP